MNKIKSYYELDCFLSGHSLGGVLKEIAELTRAELLDTPRTNEKAQDLIMEWWNNNKSLPPTIKDNRLSYFCLYQLRKYCKKNFKGGH